MPRLHLRVLLAQNLQLFAADGSSALLGSQKLGLVAFLSSIASRYHNSSDFVNPQERCTWQHLWQQQQQADLLQQTASSVEQPPQQPQLSPLHSDLWHWQQQRQPQGCSVAGAHSHSAAWVSRLQHSGVASGAPPQLRAAGSKAWLSPTLQRSGSSSSGGGLRTGVVGLCNMTTVCSPVGASRYSPANATLLHTQAQYCTSSSSSPAPADSSGGSHSGSSSSPSSSWLMRALPAACVPYAQLMRLDKPIGSWLLAWPGLWSIGLVAAPGHFPDPWLTALFGTGAVLMRGAGCTINDLWDRDIDKQVERTRSRPLAAGIVTPLAALVFLGAQLSASLAILLQLNLYTQVLGVASLSLVATYPLMKRVTWWPQAFLGLCMNYGALMGYSAAAGACDWGVVLPLYAAGVSWTLIYDTIYAHQDKRDDAVVGVKSTALLFGDKTKTWATGFAVTQTLGMLLAGQAVGCGVPYFAGVAAGAAHIAWQIRTVDLQNGPDCMAKFVSNKCYGALIYGGVVLDRLLAV